MQAWYSKVRNLKDDSEKARQTEDICNDIFHYLRRNKIKEKTKFKQRTGGEYNTFIGRMAETYPASSVETIVQDDEFWNLTLKTVFENGTI